MKISQTGLNQIARFTSVEVCS